MNETTGGGVARVQALWQAFVMTDAMTEAVKKTLVWMLGRWGIAFARPLPVQEAVVWQYIAYDDPDAPGSERTLRAANEVLAERGLLVKRTHSAAPGGYVYLEWRPDVAGLARLYEDLLAGTLSGAPTPSQVRRQESRKERDARASARRAHPV